MYSKDEATKIRQQFWITFGKYMKPIPSADGETVNWVNYKTGVKHIFFRLDATQKKASIAIVLAHPDTELRHLFFEQFEAYKALLANSLAEEWQWQQNDVNDFGIAQSSISHSLTDVNIYNQNHWPTIISFLKPRIIALDEFWSNVKPIFQAL